MNNFKRIGMLEFKALIGCNTIDVIKNPHTSKLFASASNGDVFKAQGDLDVTQPVEWLVQDGDLKAACLINKGRGQSAAPLATF